MEGNYTFLPGNFEVTEKMKNDFSDLGYINVRNLFDKEEISLIEKSLHREDFQKNAFAIGDGEGSKSKLCLWSHPGNDITGMVGRCEKVVNTMEELLGGEVYHYHTKLMMKEAFTGGKHVWHQDYGYWYKNGCLYPDMGTVFIALDKITTENGCLKVLKGTQKCGRIEHLMYSGQTMADKERVAELQEKHELVNVEMEPGDALFFHCNLLHTSDKNKSKYRRWALLCAYNRKSNNPTKEHHNPCYTPLIKVPDSAVRTCTCTDLSGKEFMDPSNDKTISLKS